MRTISEALIDSKTPDGIFILEVSSIPPNKELGAIGIFLSCLDNGKFKTKLPVMSSSSVKGLQFPHGEFYKQQPIQLNQKVIIEFYYP